MRSPRGVVSKAGTKDTAPAGAAKTAPPEAPAPPCAGEPPLGRALHRVMRALMFKEPPIPELDALPLAQLRLLWTVHHTPDATMKDFSERLSVSQSTVTQLADRLVRRGLIERHADPEDRRVVRLRTSPAGRAILGRAEADHQQTHRAVWESLTVQEQQAVIQGLEVLARAGEALRAAQGYPLPACDEPPASNRAADVGASEPGQAQPVVDLMARRVRGQSPRK